MERYALTQAYNVPLLWWQRIIVNHKKIKGWYMTPSHYLWQDLIDGLARPVGAMRRRRRSLAAGVSDLRRKRPMLWYIDPPPRPGDPDADRRRHRRVLPDPRDARRRRGGEAQGRRRRRLRGDDPGRAQAARARQAALRAVHRLHGRPAAPRPRQVAVDGRAGHEGDRDPDAGLVPDRDHGGAHRRADRHPARHHLGALPRHLGRPRRARGGRLGPRHPVVLARHADHPGAAVAVQLAAARSATCRSGRIRSPTWP